MSGSLKDQLLKVGLLTPKQARAAEQGKSRKPKVKKAQRQPRAAAPDPAAERKRQRDRELNAQREQARRAHEQSEWVRQVLASQAVKRDPDAADVVPFNFTLGARVHRVHVSAAHRQQLVAATLGVVLFDGSYHLVAADTARRLAERIPNRVWLGAPEPAVADDDDYADHPVPDDLMW